MTSLIHRISTDDVAEADRFDFWRSCFLGSELDRAPGEADEPFRGRLVAGGRADGAIFQDMRNSGLVSHFGRRESGLVLLGFVREGAVRVRHGDDRREIIDPASGLVLFDCDRPITTWSNDVALAVLALPRPAVMAALGRDRASRLAPMMRLPQAGFAAVWRAHMDELSRSGARLDHAGSLAAIEAASALAFAVLAGERTARDAGMADEALYEAALRIVRLCAGDPAFVAGRLAARLGCSRSHLYRVFAGHGTSVGACIREARLGRAHDLLLRERRTPIGLVALRCGYGDLSAFGKAFRRRFGMTPSELREHTPERRDHPPSKPSPEA